jgi:predicted  nucleic acid-binding Zn-ribbon protein
LSSLPHPHQPISEERNQFQAALDRLQAGIEQAHRIELRVKTLEVREQERAKTNAWQKLSPYLLPVLAAVGLGLVPNLIMWGENNNRLTNAEECIHDLETNYSPHDRWIAEHEAKSATLQRHQEKINTDATDGRRRIWEHLRAHQH